jgi:hypothetical protein
MHDNRSALDDTTVFVTTIGDQDNFVDCVAHLHEQSVRAPIEIIDRVAPMSAAFQQMHERCRTEYYVQVDEDMILFPHAIETLRDSIGHAANNVALLCAPLWDCDADRAIQGVKIYRSSIVKQFPYENSMSCEIRQIAKLQAAGFNILLWPLLDRSRCLGEHGKHYNPETIFRRWQRLFQKHHHYGNLAWIEPYARKKLDRYIATGEALDLYAFLGVVAGIVETAVPDREVDFREPNQIIERLQRYFPVPR